MISPACPRDPFEEHLPPLGPPEKDAFLAAWRAVDRGEGSFSELAAQAHALALDAPLRPEAAPIAPIERAPDPRDLVRIAADLEPDIAATAPDRLFGPWAAWAAPHDLLVAVAHAALCPEDPADSQGSPLERWIRSPGLPRRERPAMAAILRAPPAPYRVIALEGHDAKLAPVFELGTAAPEGPVRLPSVATPAGPLREGGGLIARVLPVLRPDGSVAHTALLAIALRDPAPPPRWLPLATWLLRLRSRKAPQTIPDVLRMWGPHLVRRMIEREWT